jgi:hypothetical protein
MSITTLIATTLIVGTEIPEATLDQLVTRWNTECQSETLTVECAGLSAAIESGLYDLLRKLSLNRQPIDREVLRAAAESNLPALAKLGVSMLGEPKSQEDADALLYAVDHPVLAVRYIAARNLGFAKNPQWLAMQPYWTGWTLAPSAHGPEESLTPDPQPDPSYFGMKSWNGLTFHYYGSDQKTAMFTTSESAESVVKRFGANRRVLSSLDAMTAQMDALQPEMDAAQKEMEAAGEANDMERLNAAMKKFEAISQKMGNVNRIGADPLNPSQTVILMEDKATKRATCTVQVERNATLNATVLTFWREGGWRK